MLTCYAPCRREREDKPANRSGFDIIAHADGRWTKTGTGIVKTREQSSIIVDGDSVYIAGNTKYDDMIIERIDRTRGGRAETVATSDITRLDNRVKITPVSADTVAILSSSYSMVTCVPFRLGNPATAHLTTPNRHYVRDLYNCVAYRGTGDLETVRVLTFSPTRSTSVVINTDIRIHQTMVDVGDLFNTPGPIPEWLPCLLGTQKCGHALCKMSIPNPKMNYSYYRTFGFQNDESVHNGALYFSMQQYGIHSFDDRDRTGLQTVVRQHGEQNPWVTYQMLSGGLFVITESKPAADQRIIDINISDVRFPTSHQPFAPISRTFPPAEVAWRLIP